MILKKTVVADDNVPPWFCLSLEDNIENHFIRAKIFTKKFKLLNHNNTIYNNDKIRFTSIYLNRTDVNGVSYIIDSNNYMAEGETTDTANPYTVKQIDNFLQTIALINQNEKVELRAQWEILDTTNMIIQGSSSNNSTFLIIERIM